MLILDLRDERTGDRDRDGGWSGWRIRCTYDFIFWRRLVHGYGSGRSEEICKEVLSFSHFGKKQMLDMCVRWALLRVRSKAFEFFGMHEGACGCVVAFFYGFVSFFTILSFLSCTCVLRVIGTSEFMCDKMSRT